MTNEPLDMIVKRRNEIAAAISDYTTKIDDLRKELPDLDVAERVLKRLSPSADEGPITTVFMTLGAQLAEKDANKIKPADIPTMPEMIIEAIKNIDHGHVGLMPADVVKYIAHTYWSGVRPELVGPIMWRMAKEGRLSKVGSRYSLPGEIDPARSKSAEAGEQGHYSGPVQAGSGDGT